MDQLRGSVVDVRAAGIIIFKEIDGVKKILILKSNKGYDLPKGKINHTEDPITCALRETEEETGINDLNFVVGTKSIIIDKCQMYCATTTQEPVLIKNPETNKFEHTGYEWCDPIDAIQKLPRYLAVAVKWAIKHIQ